MKNYPKALADAEAMTETIRYLYSQAEHAQDQA